MITEEQAALLAQPNTAIIGVNRAKGGPQLTVVWYVWDGKDFSFFRESVTAIDRMGREETRWKAVSPVVH